MIICLNAARKKGLTTAVAIAEESGVDANIISRLKTGRQKSPDLIQVVKLYKACGASLDYGFGIEGCDTDELQRELEKLRYENERHLTPSLRQRNSFSRQMRMHSKAREKCCSSAPTS